MPTMKNYPTAKDANRKIVITVNSNKTLARIFDDKEVISSGVATCSYEDTFDFKTGAELALARAFKKLPKPVEEEWKVVKRRPKVGDYVRIIRGKYSFDKPGMILKIDRVGFGIVGVSHKNHPTSYTDNPDSHPEFMWNYRCPNEVEVVEPVKKEEWKVVNRKPKVGDHIRIVKPRYNFNERGDVLEVSNVNEFGCPEVRNDNHPHGTTEIIVMNDDYLWHYQHDEYEVVEKVKEPNFRKITRKPRPGDYIRLTSLNPFYTEQFDKVGDVLKISNVSGNGLVVDVHANDHPKLVAHFGGIDNVPFAADDQMWRYCTLFESYEFVEEVTE